MQNVRSSFLTSFDNPNPVHWEQRVSATGLPGTSPHVFFVFSFSLDKHFDSFTVSGNNMHEAGLRINIIDFMWTVKSSFFPRVVMI